MLDSKALTKIQSVILVATIAVAAVVGGVAYIYWPKDAQSKNTIKIGVCADLDMLQGKSTWESVVLAAEQINNEGGILGRQVEVIGEDSDGENPSRDITTGTNALTKLITLHNVEFIVSSDPQFMLAYQDIASQHKKILFGVSGITNDLTQRVEDEYNKYKYFFRTMPNATHALLGTTDCVNVLREYSGFNKIAILVHDVPTWAAFMPVIANYLSADNGFEVVYQNKFPGGTFDFSSYLSAIESSGAEVLIPMVYSEDGIILVKDWYDRQSPFVLWGVNAYLAEPAGWNRSDGKCQHTTNVGSPVTAGYPLTSQTLPFREAYSERWGSIPTFVGAIAYDTIRFILYDALERAQTTDTEAIIEALEETEIETSQTRNFVFTSSHDVLGGENINNPDEDHMVVILFQWQNGEQVPVYPKELMEEAGATYTYPPWSGPWDDLN